MDEARIISGIAGDDEEEGVGPPVEAAPPPSLVYREALERYDGARLHAVGVRLGMEQFPNRVGKLPGAVADYLGEPRVAEQAVADLSPLAQSALNLFAITDSPVWPLEGIEHTLRILGIDPIEALTPLLDSALIAFVKDDAVLVNDFSKLLQARVDRPKTRRLVAHAAAVSASRTRPPELPAGTFEPLQSVTQIRESDGLEPILRLAVIWQRVSEAPLRQTQNGTFYKRDRERIEDDPVLAGPIADAIEPLPDMPAFWLAIARGVGLLDLEPNSDRVKAAPPDYWRDNAFHLPQMIAAKWLSLRQWHEQGGMQREGAEAMLALPFARPAVLLWLAALDENDWIALDDLAAFLHSQSSDWDRPAFLPSPALIHYNGQGRPKTVKPRRTETATTAKTDDAGPLDAMLLGAAYQLGLVRTAEEVGTRRRAVQLTPLGRYALAIGPPPPARPAFEHFLFVQPSFEVIAYRQGLTASLIGRFSRFAVWSAIGAALTLSLTAESVYRGLEGGLTPKAMLDLLAKHSSRPLPTGVAEALKTWAGRRDRVTYYASVTLVEFATPAELDEALVLWPKAGRPPIRITDRLLLVEDELHIPFARFRMTGSRDYRRPPEICVEVESEGIQLMLDMSRSDLLVDAEVSRFADELPLESSRGSSNSPRRRFSVSSSSLARGMESGLNAQQLSLWFERRTGADAPPAIKLLMLAMSGKVPPLSASRPLVLNAPSAEILDGLTQHPDTRDYIGKRLGPTSAIIPEAFLERFRSNLQRLGLNLEETLASPR